MHIKKHILCQKGKKLAVLKLILHNCADWIARGVSEKSTTDLDMITSTFKVCLGFNCQPNNLIDSVNLTRMKRLQRMYWKKAFNYLNICLMFF